MEKRWELDDEELVEAFESLPEEEQKRLAAESDLRLVANTEKRRLENDELERKVAHLKELARREEEMTMRIEAFLAQIDLEKDDLRRERESLLAPTVSAT